MAVATKTSLQIKTELRSRSKVCNHSMLVTLCGMAEVSFPLIGANDFKIKAENEKSTAAASRRCHHYFKCENSSHRSADYVKNCTKKGAARA